MGRPAAAGRRHDRVNSVVFEACCAETTANRLAAAFKSSAPAPPPCRARHDVGSGEVGPAELAAGVTAEDPVRVGNLETVAPVDEVDSFCRGTSTCRPSVWPPRCRPGPPESGTSPRHRYTSGRFSSLASAFETSPARCCAAPGSRRRRGRRRRRPRSPSSRASVV